MILKNYESVVLSTRVRLARNFKDYPFPARLMRDPYAEEQASEMISLLSAELTSMEPFDLYVMNNLPDDQIAYLEESNLISRDLVSHKKISAALISRNEKVSVMINEEDHIREQYFLKGFELGRAYEHIQAIDEIISDSIPFAYDGQFGYLTACPTNLGTGLRASAMVFLPACYRRGLMREIESILSHLGLTVRGAAGEGSGADGDLFQISNEVTLGISEDELLTNVENAVNIVVQLEIDERKKMKAEDENLADKVFRNLGVLLYCRKIDEKEFIRRVADLKLGVAVGCFDLDEDAAQKTMGELDDLILSMRSANISHFGRVSPEGIDVYRAERSAEVLRSLLGL